VTRLWVVDASPLISLSGIGRIDLLRKLADPLLVPRAVADEVAREGRSDAAAAWIAGEGAACVLADEKAIGAEQWNLGAGESSVLAACMLRPGHEAILDDRPARSRARMLGIPYRGTVGVLLVAKHDGLIDAVRPEVLALMERGFRLDIDFANALLAREREAPLA